MPLLPFMADGGNVVSVTTNSEIPKELDLFYRNEAQFLPEGKTFATLTDEEKEEVKNKYRFDGLKPGLYQTITGIGEAR